VKLNDFSTFDRIIGMVGLLLGVPTILEFIHARTVNAVLLIIIILGLVMILLLRRHEARLPTWTYEHVHKVLTFKDANASLATIETVIDARANHTGVTQLWFRNMSADGSIDNFRVDGIAVPPHQVKKKGGSLELCKQFDVPLSRGETRTVTLICDLHDCFSEPQEGITHVTTTITKKLTLRVVFHSAKPPRTAHFFFGGSGGIDTSLKEPKKLDNGLTLEAQVESLDTGAYYTLDWTWG
jgi:hypothetical protein